MEFVQEVLDAQGYLNPRQIIEYMAGKFTDRILDTDDFYDILRGVFGKETKPLTIDDFHRDREELSKRGVFLHRERHNVFAEEDFNLPPGKHLRFYLNASDSNGRAQILESIVNEFRGEKFKIKTVVKGSSGFSRYDNTVLYVHMTDAAKYVDFLQQLSFQHPGCFNPEVPILTRKIGKGIGYATSACRRRLHVLDGTVDATNMSFHLLHSAVLYRTFASAIRYEIGDLSDVTKLYRKALLGAEFNPDKLYLNAGMKEPFELAPVKI